MVRALNVVKASGGSAPRDKKKPTTVHTPADKARDTPTCSECEVAIGKNVKALQCDLFSSRVSWKCIDCLDIRPPLYESLIDGQGKELRWFCKSCDASVMKHSEKLDEIVNMLKLLSVKTDCIETALAEKADKTSLDDFSINLFASTPVAATVFRPWPHTTPVAATGYAVPKRTLPCEPIIVHKNAG